MLALKLIKYVRTVNTERFPYGEEQNENEIPLSIFSDSEKSFDTAEEILWLKY